MKKITLLLISFCLFFSICTIVPLTSEESDMYYVNVQILKIFPHKLGYYVIYRRAGLKTGEVYIPKEWFDRRDQRAILNLTDANIDPYLTIVSKKGEFNYIQVVAHKNVRHPTWGVLSPGADVAEKFKVEKLALEY